jgi:hypothetical protein
VRCRWDEAAASAAIAIATGGATSTREGSFRIIVDSSAPTVQTRHSLIASTSDTASPPPFLNPPRVHSSSIGSIAGSMLLAHEVEACIMEGATVALSAEMLPQLAPQHAGVRSSETPTPSSFLPALRRTSSSMTANLPPPSQAGPAGHLRKLDSLPRISQLPHLLQTGARHCNLDAAALSSLPAVPEGIPEMPAQQRQGQSNSLLPQPLQHSAVGSALDVQNVVEGGEPLNTRCNSQQMLTVSTRLLPACNSSSLSH